jgi:hypothetical protein
MQRLNRMLLAQAEAARARSREIIVSGGVAHAAISWTPERFAMALAARLEAAKLRSRTAALRREATLVRERAARDRRRRRGGLLTPIMLHELADELVALTAEASAPQQQALLAMAWRYRALALGWATPGSQRVH